MVHFPNTMIIATLSLLLLQTDLINITAVKGDPDTTIEGIECSVDKWAPNDPYGTLVERILTDLAANGPAQHLYDYYIKYSSDDTDAYGFSLCYGLRDTSPEDCAACLAQAQQNLLTMCPFSIHADVVMADCTMRYDNFPFYDI